MNDVPNLVRKPNYDYRRALTDDIDYFPQPEYQRFCPIPPLGVDDDALDATDVWDYEECHPDSWVVDDKDQVESMSVSAHTPTARPLLGPLEKQMLKLSSDMYRSKVHLGPDHARTTCIRGGAESFNWTDLSSGYSWIGVNGSDYSFVVTMRTPILKLPANKIQLSAKTVLEAALANMMIRDMPLEFSFREDLPQIFQSGHLAVVSVTASASASLEYEPGLRSLALQFLEEKLAEPSTLTYKETAQIAICALKLLLGRTFNPYEIQAIGWGKSLPFKGEVFSLGKKCVVKVLTNICLP